MGKWDAPYINGSAEPVKGQVGHDASDGSRPDEPPVRKRTFQSFLWFLNQCSVYFSIQLGRCVLFSFAALGIVLLLMCRLFLWWHNCCIACPVISYGYMFGVVISGIFIFIRHRKLNKQIKNMEKGTIGGNKVYICKMPVTPFTIGVFHSKVVVPKVMIDTFETEELQAVLLHERMHIRLGHLWFYLLWDILCMLPLWVRKITGI